MDTARSNGSLPLAQEIRDNYLTERTEPIELDATSSSAPLLHAGDRRSPQGGHVSGQQPISSSSEVHDGVSQKEVVPKDDDTYKERVSGEDTNKETVACSTAHLTWRGAGWAHSMDRKRNHLYNETQSSDEQKRRVCHLPVKLFWILAIISTLGVIAAIIGVAVAVTRHRGSGSSTSTALQVPILNNSAIASIAYYDGNNVTQVRVYHQDESAALKESAWNGSARAWYVSNSNITSTLPKPGTPLAAAKFGHDPSSPQVNLYYLLPNNTINRLSTTDGLTWQPPPNVPDATPPLADANTKLTAAFLGHQNCTTCANSTFLVYQYEDQLMVESTSSDNGAWTVQKLAATSAEGMDLALFYLSVDELRLFFEDAGGRLWYFQFKQGEWVDRSAFGPVQTDLIPNSPITALSYEEPDSGISAFYDVLYFPEGGGLNVSGWIGDSTMSNQWAQTYSPKVPTGLTSNVSLATNDLRRVYVLEDGVLKEYSIEWASKDSWTNWRFLGHVLTL